MARAIEPASMAVKTVCQLESPVGIRHKAPADSAMARTAARSSRRVNCRTDACSQCLAALREASGLERGEVCARALFTSDGGERIQAAWLPKLCAQASRS